MVNGIDKFKEWFKGYEEQYVIIGGTACSILLENADMRFRATKDIDLVLIVEAIDHAFVERFWEYIEGAQYEHLNKSTGVPQFYRFSKPISKEYPSMIELFSRKPESILLKDDSRLTPLPIEEEISSLSAILLDEAYYEFLKSGKKNIDGVIVLDVEHIIPFKAKAYLDLNNRKLNGEHVDSKDIKKHKNDIFRLSELLSKNITIDTPEEVKQDMVDFIESMKNEEVNLKQLNVVSTKEEILQQLKDVYKIR